VSSEAGGNIVLLCPRVSVFVQKLKKNLLNKKVCNLLQLCVMVNRRVFRFMNHLTLTFDLENYFRI